MDVIHAIRSRVWEAICYIFWFGHDYLEDGISPYSKIYQCTNCCKIKFAKMKWFAENEVVKDWGEFLATEEDAIPHGEGV